jgi:hypothetical protein
MDMSKITERLLLKTVHTKRPNQPDQPKYLLLVLTRSAETEHCGAVPEGHATVARAELNF